MWIAALHLFFHSNCRIKVSTSRGKSLESGLRWNAKEWLGLPRVTFGWNYYRSTLGKYDFKNVKLVPKFILFCCPDIEVHKINHVQEYYDLRLSNNLKAEDENFKIPLSIRTNRDGYIFLCDGKRATSNCYCIILQGFGGTKSVITKCLVNTNTRNNVKWNVSNVSIEVCMTELLQQSMIIWKYFSTSLLRF